MRAILLSLAVILFLDIHHATGADSNVLQTLNTPRAFPPTQSKAEWQSRAKEIQEQILVSCGLWPTPAKTALHAHVFDRKDRDGYSVEKVYFQSYPGFYVAGNLYRPIGKGRGPFPAVLNPHGHWENGRLADTKDGSIAARCISFARQGMIAFSYDMIGYNDTRFADGARPETLPPGYKRHRTFATNAVDELWGISQMGLQTWDSIRALDFLESLPDVDKKRLACTGESGGGTQTFMLGAVDRRLAVQAPVVMVSHTMQGGCSCENVPGLRINYSNMEIAAAPAPRPQILVAASGDWTKDTMTVEGPAIEKIYRLFGAEDKLRYVRFDFNHNYNQTSREAVYEWFAKFLLHSPDRSALQELPYTKEPDAELRVFPEGKQPADVVTEQALIRYLVSESQKALAQAKPKDKKSLAEFKEEFLPAWKHTLQIQMPDRELTARVGDDAHADPARTQITVASASGRSLPLTVFYSAKEKRDTFVILAHPDGKRAYLDGANQPTGLAATLLKNGVSVLVFDAFLTGELKNPELAAKRKPLENFFTTYNRTDLQERVQDLITACAFAKGAGKGPRVFVHGAGRAGLWALLAAPAADGVIADCDQFEVSTDENLVVTDLFVPGLRRIGDFAGSASLAAPHPLLLHNTGEKFQTAWLRDVYRAIGSEKQFVVNAPSLSDEEQVKWILAAR